MARTPAQIKIVREQLDRHPDMPSRTLARMLYKKHPDWFTSEESLLSSIRYARGAKGKYHRKNQGCVTHPRPKKAVAACMQWGSVIPDPDKNSWQWHELPKDVSRWLVLADMHVPYHDKQALTVACQHASGNCDGLLLLGDAIDCYQLSQFDRDPRRRSIVQEIECLKRLLDALAMLDVKHIVWKGGNHEHRLESYLRRKAPELLDVPDMTLQKWCELEERGIRWIPDQHPIRHRNLAILHGHEWSRGFVAPVNPARGAFLRAQECVLSAHQHRKSNHPEKSIFDRLVQCWSVGCLCDCHPEYAPLNKWDIGFAYLDTGASWTIHNHSIIQGEVY